MGQVYTNVSRELARDLGRQGTFKYLIHWQAEVLFLILTFSNLHPELVYTNWLLNLKQYTKKNIYVKYNMYARNTKF